MERQLQESLMSMMSSPGFANAIQSMVRDLQDTGGRRHNRVSMDRNMNESGLGGILVEPCDSPSDEDDSLMSVPFKLEMDAREVDHSGQQAVTERRNELMDYYKNELVTVANKFGISVVEMGRMQLVAGGRRIMIPFMLECVSWRKSLVKLLNEFFVTVGRNRISTFEMPSISTHSLQLYPLRLLNIHENLPLAHLKFGSVIDNGRIGVHWIMARPLEEAKYDEEYERDMKFTMSFEYDRAIIVVHYSFQVPTKRDQSSPGIWYNKVRGKVMIEMASIHRIFFNQKTEGSGNRRISLVLLLDSPPKLQDNFDRTWTYRTILRRGRHSGEISDQETLHDSKAVILEFGKYECKDTTDDRCSCSDRLFYDVISRLRHVTGKKIEFTGFEESESIKGSLRGRQWNATYRRPKLELEPRPVCPYAVTAYFDGTVCGYIQEASKSVVEKERIEDGISRDYHIRWKEFRLRALLQGILDRGMEYRIELLCNRDSWYKFVSTIAAEYAYDEQRTLYALERVMCVISEDRPNCTIPVLFKKEWDEATPNRRSALFSEREKKEGYWRIMKFVATPTRLIFIGYETIMGNRVMKRFARNENDIIRLTFRNDRYGPIRISDFVPEVQERIERILREGITYAGRTYAWLGCSNSQFREQGCYMVHVEFNSSSPHDIRRQMGDFHKLPNIPKMLARLGQVFTQGKASITALYPSDVEETYDVTGGRDPAGKPFVFSDGVGLISVSLASSLSREHGLKSIASAFQIRFRGEKGLLCIDPSIDDRNELLKKLERSEEEKRVYVRPSMIKFEVAEEDQSYLEIVKISSTSPAFLNRPFINILCQVSQKQSAGCHRRVKRRVEELMHANLSECFQAHFIEEKAVDAIKEMSFPFPADFTPSNATTDPFFQALLRANSKYVTKKKLSKMNIRIPSSRGRMMLGVMDTTGLLQHGQIFCQYTRSISKHVDCEDGQSMDCRGESILTGPTLITKNPCISSGDVRMFEAIDIPALRHLIDVIVFPMHGPRPHPDEMAGSDLDGDEFIVIWDEELFLERNEEASVFPIGEETKKWMIPRDYYGEVDFKRCEEKKAEFFTEAIVHGQSGMISNAHLACSDLYGLESKPAKSLEFKIAQTLDFQKSGIKPEPMKELAEQDPHDATREIPAERNNLKPDYFRNFREPGYESRGILGHVYREAIKYDHALDCGEELMPKIIRDPSFLVDGWEKYKYSMAEELVSYAHAMKSVVEHYGIASEEELLSGMIISMKKRLSEKEEYDGTHFTTNRVVSEKVRRVIETARERFFENLVNSSADLEQAFCTRVDVRTGSILNKRVRPRTRNIENIRRKAAAAYNVAYEAASASAQKGEQFTILLSFPWVFYDALDDIKRRPDWRILAEEVTEIQSTEPLAVRLSEFIDQYCEDPSNAGKYAEFKDRFHRDDSILARSLNEDQGLSRVSFVLLEWANHVGGLSRRFGEEQLLSLFVLFGLGEVCSRGRRFMPQGDQIDQSWKGDHLLRFLDYVSSHEFRMRSSISFAKMGGGALMRGEWRSFSEKALPSFLSLVITHRLDLPMQGGKRLTALREYEPRVMLLPADFIDEDLEEVADALSAVSGCQVTLRKLCSHWTGVIVSAIGTSEQLRVLSSYIYPPAPKRETATLKGTIESMALFTYERLMKAARNMH